MRKVLLLVIFSLLISGCTSNNEKNSIGSINDSGKEESISNNVNHEYECFEYNETNSADSYHSYSIVSIKSNANFDYQHFYTSNNEEFEDDVRSGNITYLGDGMYVFVLPYVKKDDDYYRSEIFIASFDNEDMYAIGLNKYLILHGEKEGCGIDAECTEDLIPSSSELSNFDYSDYKCRVLK